MKTIDIEIALMRKLGIRINLIVPNVSWGMDGMHECDLLCLSKSGYATEVEIKVSKADILNDKKKDHNHEHRLITYLYFAVPEKLEEFALKHIPSHAGLYIITTNDYGSMFVSTSRQAQKQKGEKWSIEDRYKLARLGALRILGLKSKIKELKEILNE